MLIILLVVLVAIILVIVVKDFVIPMFLKSPVAEGGPKPPAFLSVPLPSIEKIKEAADNPKIDELKFYRAIFVPIEREEGIDPSKPQTLEDLAKKVKVETMGRPNPFIPFEGFEGPSETIKK